MRGVSSLIVGVRPLAMREALGGGAVARGAVAGACRGGLLAAGGAPAGLLGMRPAVMAWKSGLGERAHYVDGRKKRVHDLTLRGVTRTDPTEFGKEAMKRLRKDKATDYIPGRVQDSTGTRVYCILERKAVDMINTKRNLFNHVWKVVLNDGKIEIPVIVRTVAAHPVKEYVQHLDMVKFEPEVGIEVDIPVTWRNEEKCPGVKSGGVVNLVLRTIRVIVKTQVIPDIIEVNIEKLGVGDRLWLKDVELPMGLEVAALQHYAKCPVITIGRTRQSILEARRKAEEATKEVASPAKPKK